MEGFTINGELPLLEVQGVWTPEWDYVIQMRCPSGLSVLSSKDAKTFMANLKREISSFEGTVDCEPFTAWVDEFELVD